MKVMYKVFTKKKNLLFNFLFAMHIIIAHNKDEQRKFKGACTARPSPPSSSRSFVVKRKEKAKSSETFHQVNSTHRYNCFNFNERFIFKEGKERKRKGRSNRSRIGGNLSLIGV